MNNRYLFRCYKCRLTRRVDVPSEYSPYDYLYVTREQWRHACNATWQKPEVAFNATRIVGQIVPTVRCNANCRASVSGKCRCSCGGENHGANYSDTVLTQLAQER
jgi:hypothetical protein